MAFDSLAAGKTRIREELPLAPSFPGLIPSPLPHLSMPKKTGKSRSISEGRVPGDKSKVGLWVGFLLLFLIGQQNLRQEC